MMNTIVIGDSYNFGTEYHVVHARDIGDYEKCLAINCRHKGVYLGILCSDLKEVPPFIKRNTEKIITL